MKEERSLSSREGGFALILAILSLMLLTFLGLTLATTTSTELQIATNFRWSQQALYNAEAGLESAKLLLANVATADGNWRQVVPAPRPGSWPPPITGVNLGDPAASPAGPAARDYERNNCTPGDRGGIGYGVVLRANGARWEDVSDFMGQAINGAFTIWVRRDLVSNVDGSFSDDPAGAPVNLVITTEGVAPYVGTSTAFTRANQATRILQMSFSLAAGDPCLRQGTQEGAGPTGENFDACSPLTAGAGGSLESVFGGRGGTLNEIP